MSQPKLHESHLGNDGAEERLLSVIKTSEKNETNLKNSKTNGVSFTEALALTKFGKFNYFVIMVSGLVLANVLLETSAIGFILPIMQCDLHLTNQNKGVLSAIGFAGMIASSHLWGFLADTKGRRKVIRPTLLAGFVVTVFSSFSTNFWTMVILRFINGFFVSGGSATIYAYLGEFHTDKKRNHAMMGSSFLFALGAMAVPVLAFLVINRDWVIPLPFLGIDYKPWRFFMVVCAIPGLICGISLYALPESPKFLLSVDKEDATIEALQQMHRWNGNKEPLQYSHILPEEDVLELRSKATTDKNFVVALLQTMWNQTAPLFQRTYLRTTLIVCTIQFWLFVATNGLYMWFPHIINSMGEFMKEHPEENKLICQIVYDKHASIYKTDGTMHCITKLENTTYFYSLLMEILYASSFALIGLVINRVGKIFVLFFCMVFFTSCGLASVFVADPSIAAYLYVLLFLVGVSINVLGATTVDLYPTHLRAMAICISLMMGRIGSMVGANVVSAILATQCELTFYITCAALFACAFLAVLLPRKRSEESSSTKPVLQES